MEEQTILKEVLYAFKLHSEHIDKKIDEVKVELVQRMNSFENRMDDFENRIDSFENKMDSRFDRLEKKYDGSRVELSETQETVDYLSSKVVQHEKKIRNL